MSKELTRISKFLSLILRHAPERVGLTLDEGGWVEVALLLNAVQGAGVALDDATLRRVVAENDKQRFALSDDGLRIRANQGHSVRITLGLQPILPPPLLYHGTATRFLDSIRSAGLRPGKRTHVHLSNDRVSALKVGARRGAPVVLTVYAGQMAKDGFEFVRSENGVWLTATVPRRYLAIPDEVQ